MKKSQRDARFVKPCNAMVSNFSMFRKIMRLGNWLEASQSVYGILLNPKGHSASEIVTELADLWTTIFDDVHCLIKMGVFSSKRALALADDQAAKSWIIAIAFNLRKEFCKYQEIQRMRAIQDSEKLRNDAFWTQISFFKFLCDGIFCSFDVWDIPLDGIVQTLAGLGSGMLSYYKLYQKEAAKHAK